MKLNKTVSIVVSLLLSVQSAVAQTAPEAGGSEAEIIRTMVTSRSLLKAGSTLFETKDLAKLYAGRKNEPIWTKGSAPLAMANALKEMITTLSARHGLIASDYWTNEIEAYYKNLDASNVSAFELIASDSLIKFASHLSNGRIEPALLDNDVRFNKRVFTEFDVLTAAVSGSPSELARTIEKLAPEHSYYRDVVSILAELRKVKAAGGYTEINKPTGSLTVGTKHPSVPSIRERINQHGFNLDTNSDIYDAEVAAAVQEIQKENVYDISATLKPDSGFWNVVMPSVDARIAQAEANLEKLRWLPKRLESRMIFANTNATEVKVYENGQVIKSFKSINGRILRRTPMMKTYITRVIFNPTWTATDSVVDQDKLPKIKADPKFLSEINMKMFDRAIGKEVDPTTLDWGTNARDIVKKHMFVQGPGPHNALGVFKFPLVPDTKSPMEANSDQIFMHYTDNPTLFRDAKRQLSSGCVRLEMAEWLAGYLLRNVGGYDPTAIRGIIAKGTPNEVFRTDYSVNLPANEYMPVYMMPLTIEKTASGHIRFMDDNYLHDRRIQNRIMSAHLRSSQVKPSESIGEQVTTGLRVNGERSPSQHFSVALASRCEEPTFGPHSKSGSRMPTRRCDAPVQIKLNETTQLTPGQYMVGFENTMYPGFVRIQEGKITQIQLQKIVVPEKFAKDTSIKIYRDMTSFHEQKKVYFEKFYLGRNLFRQTIRSFGDFYLAGLNEIDVVDSSNYTFCSEAKIAQLQLATQIREHAKYICESYNSAKSMIDYADLYNFQSNGTYQEAVADHTGDVVPKRHLRYLVAAPMNAAGSFVSVMPGIYRINGDQSKIDVRVATGSLVETYPNVRRTFSNSKTGVEIDQSDAPVALAAAQSVNTIVTADNTVLTITNGETTTTPIAPKAPCEGAKLWRTSSRSYCNSDGMEGCSRASAKLCQEVRMDLRFRK
ncbi:MAG: L,D-transpeptidase family protein [Bdellovibrionaceae bacterium]|nr:L,D-transpeptidase family protein [Bdellovibrio sp.]